MKFVGAHVSIAGGVENAPLNARAIGARAFAMFTKNQRQWVSPPLTEASIAAFRQNCQTCGFDAKYILPHDGYLINLCNPDPEKRKISVDAFIDEMHRCALLGLDKLNFHPGSALDSPTDAAVKLVAEGVKIAIDQVPHVKAVIENTAGQGTNLGSNFAQIGKLIELIGQNDRVGVCLDTCHSFAAGYDLGSREGYDYTMTQFEKYIGFEFLAGVHLNDSKSKLGGHLDRHDSIGKGELGVHPFAWLMNDPRFDDIPLVLETIDETIWPQEIQLLYSLQEKK